MTWCRATTSRRLRQRARRPAAPDPTTPGSAGASPPGGGGSSGAPPSGGADGERPGVREQLGRIRAAARLLVDAHLALLRAELAVIGEQIKQIAAFVGGIVVLALYAISLLAIGGTLFLGEWIFGSIGWGVLHGVLLAVGIIVALALMVIDAPRPLISRPLIWGLVAAVGVTLVLGLNVPRNLSEWVAGIVIANVAPTLDPQYAPAVVAMVFFAVVIGIVGLIVGARGQGALGAVWVSSSVPCWAAHRHPLRRPGVRLAGGRRHRADRRTHRLDRAHGLARVEGEPRSAGALREALAARDL